MWEVGRAAWSGSTCTHPPSFAECQLEGPAAGANISLGAIGFVYPHPNGELSWPHSQPLCAATE
jgi:hypothetical protein